MSAKRIRKLLTVVLSTSMVLGCTITAFADTTVDGKGDYEGGAMKYPTLSVTLPTIPEGTYNYIADPNGLIAATSAAAHDGATFTGTTGIFFKTTDATGEAKAIYTNESKAQTVTNNNAQDIDVTIKLEQKTAGDEGIAYSNTATFENTDKAKKLYLAVTDGAETPKTAALTASGAAIITTTVPGVTSNYEPKYDSTTKKYGYALKANVDPQTWKTCSYKLTGALNMGAEWGDGLKFPAIKVTWSAVEHLDDAAPSIATTSYTMAADTAVTVQYSLGVGDSAAEGIDSVVWSAYPTYNLYDDSTIVTKNTQANTFTLAAAAIDNMIAGDGNSQTIKVTFDDGTEVTLTFNDPQ